MRYVSGLYKITHESGRSYNVLASKNNARFLMNESFKIGIIKVKLIKSIHKMDFPQISNL